MATVIVEDGQVDRAIRKLQKALHGEHLALRSADTRRFVSEQDRRRMKRRRQEKKRMKG